MTARAVATPHRLPQDRPLVATQLACRRGGVTQGMALKPLDSFLARPIRDLGAASAKIDGLRREAYARQPLERSTRSPAQRGWLEDSCSARGDSGRRSRLTY